MNVGLEIIQEDLSKFIGIQTPMASVNVSSMDEAIKSLQDNGDDNIRYKINNSYPSIKIGSSLSLDGVEKPSVIEVGDGSIITLFDKTPYPKNDTDVVCPHFLELKWANGCNFNCSWCYLNGTLRFRPMGKKPYLKNEDKILQHINAYLNNVEIPSILNSGELADSLVFEGKGFSLSRDIVPLFRKQTRHKLLILTKSVNIKGILNSEAQDSIIVSISINGIDVAKRWEKGAPNPIQRIAAAAKLKDAGYPIRVRIDPLVPVSNWKQDYKRLIRNLFDQLEPARITIGSLRGLRSTINNCKDTTWIDYLDEKSNWGKKIPLPKRLEMYSYIIDILSEDHSYDSVGVCKETKAVWRNLGLDYKKIKCNCIL